MLVFFPQFQGGGGGHIQSSLTKDMIYNYLFISSQHHELTESLTFQDWVGVTETTWL